MNADIKQLKKLTIGQIKKLTEEFKALRNDDPDFNKQYADDEFINWLKDQEVIK